MVEINPPNPFNTVADAFVKRSSILLQQEPPDAKRYVSAARYTIPVTALDLNDGTVRLQARTGSNAFACDLPHQLRNCDTTDSADLVSAILAARLIDPNANPLNLDTNVQIHYHSIEQQQPVWMSLRMDQVDDLLLTAGQAAMHGVTGTNKALSVAQTLQVAAHKLAEQSLTPTTTIAYGIEQLLAKDIQAGIDKIPFRSSSEGISTDLQVPDPWQG
jgi:hypothetical protein